MVAGAGDASDILTHPQGGVRDEGRPPGDGVPHSKGGCRVFGSHMSFSSVGETSPGSKPLGGAVCRAGDACAALAGESCLCSGN